MDRELFAWLVIIVCSVLLLLNKKLRLKQDVCVMLAFTGITSAFALAWLKDEPTTNIHNETYVVSDGYGLDTIWMTSDTILNTDIVDTTYSINYKRIMDKLGKRESSNNYYAINRYGYIGRYQFGALAMQDIGSPSHSYFLRNIKAFTPAKQDRCMIALINRNAYYLRDYKHYVGESINGITITWEGLLQACHLVGNGSVKSYLTSRGTIVAKDANGTSLEEYLQL